MTNAIFTIPSFQETEKKPGRPQRFNDPVNLLNVTTFSKGMNQPFFSISFYAVGGNAVAIWSYDKESDRDADYKSLVENHSAQLTISL